MWTPPALASEARPWSGDVWRVVESQSKIATLKLVDTLDEQAVLEAELEGTKPYELALLLVRLFRGLDAVVGGDEASLRSWMAAGNRALGGTPRDLVQTVTGLVAAVDYVDAARARV